MPSIINSNIEHKFLSHIVWEYRFKCNLTVISRNHNKQACHILEVKIGEITIFWWLTPLLSHLQVTEYFKCQNKQYLLHQTSVLLHLQ